jgi:hypothetical protein
LERTDDHGRRGGRNHPQELKSRRPKPCVASAEALRTAYTASFRSSPERFRPTASYTTLWDATEDWLRQLNVGTYELGDGPLKLLLGELPCERVLALGEEDQPPHRLAFYLPGSRMVLLLEALSA